MSRKNGQKKLEYDNDPKKIPAFLQIWQLGDFDLSKIKYGSFGYINSDKRKLFIKNLKWLLGKYK